MTPGVILLSVFGVVVVVMGVIAEGVRWLGHPDGVSYEETFRPPVEREHVKTAILLQSVDNKGRPDAIVRAASYRAVPNFGTWDGMQIHTKIAPHTWHVHYEDFKV